MKALSTMLSWKISLTHQGGVSSRDQQCNPNLLAISCPSAKNPMPGSCKPDPLYEEEIPWILESIDSSDPKAKIDGLELRIEVWDGKSILKP